MQKDRQVAKGSAAALLLATRRTKRVLSSAADDVLSEAAHSVPDDPKRASVFQTVLRTARLLVPALTGALVLAGRNTAESAKYRLGKELHAIGIETELGEITSLRMFEGIETAHAVSAAESLAAQWRSQTLSRTSLTIRKEESVYKAFGEARKALQKPIERTAITETTRAYNEAHLEELHQAMDRSPELRRFVEQNSIVREWTALVDACPHCRDLDGMQVGIDETFPDGDPPAHPNCQCHTIVTTASVSKSRAA